MLRYLNAFHKYNTMNLVLELGSHSNQSEFMLVWLHPITFQFQKQTILGTGLFQRLRRIMKNAREDHWFGGSNRTHPFL
jgi:hypothetical protein